MTVWSWCKLWLYDRRSNCANSLLVDRIVFMHQLLNPLHAKVKLLVLKKQLLLDPTTTADVVYSSSCCAMNLFIDAMLQNSQLDLIEHKENVQQKASVTNNSKLALNSKCWTQCQKNMVKSFSKDCLCIWIWCMADSNAKQTAWNCIKSRRIQGWYPTSLWIMTITPSWLVWWMWLRLFCRTWTKLQEWRIGWLPS